MKIIKGFTKFMVVVFCIIGVLMTPIILSVIADLSPDSFIGKILNLIF
jgi:hypothetical protein